jgi:hypothetical protein
MLAEVEKLLARLSSKPVRNHSTCDFGREENPAARSVVVPQEKAESLVRALRRELPPGYVAFIGTSRWLGKERHEGAVEVVAGPGQSQFEILRIAKSDAVNHGMETEALITRLQKYDRELGISLFQAETDTVAFDILREPKDWGAFARDLYDFCPDIVDQGVGSVEELEEQVRELRQVLLWWD